MTPIDIGRDEAHERAAAELAKAKYGGAPSWLEDGAERFFSFIERLIEQFLDLTRIRQSSGGAVNWGFVLAVVLVLVCVGLVVWRVGLPRWQRRQRDAALDLDVSVAPADYRTRADALAAAGDWAAAIRDRFRAVVRDLEDRTILDPRPARTAWEAAYAASRQLPGCADELHEAAETFNAVVYGSRVADAGGYRRLVEIDGTVVRVADAVDLAADPVGAS